MWTRRLAVVVLVLWMSGAVAASPGAVAASPGAAGAAEATTTQLPRGVRPLHYDLAISPDAAALRFTGSAAILIEVREPTARLVLNAVDLSFTSVRLAPLAGGRVRVPAAVEVQADAETVTLTFARPLGRGRYRLHMAYAGSSARRSPVSLRSTTTRRRDASGPCSPSSRMPTPVASSRAGTSLPTRPASAWRRRWRRGGWR